MLTHFKREEFGQYSSLNREEIRQQSQSMHADKIKMLFAQHDLEEPLDDADGHIQNVNDSNTDYI